MQGRVSDLLASSEKGKLERERQLERAKGKAT